ncbi:putative penicillin amidase [Microseira wollei NIES-4236]|uniref:Penicillin amidase n=2 Tax=Microseira wollei TaxID=467598 RepID=A0AAV3XGT3_9CYAN|nr:putative penicillin amidase [Microseira wollei NIES-4236]
MLALTAITGGFAIYTVRRSWPQETGTIKLSGLKDKVEVFRDKWGVPHIYASNQHDLFMAQGYIHAQDRFWQMDFWRHIGSGRLAEMAGYSQVDTDKFLRTLGWARVAQQEFAKSDPNTKAILQAYADGVNAYLRDRQGDSISLEYTVLKQLNPNYQPKPWQPLHTLTWVKAMAWDLSTSLDSEIENAILSKTLTPSQINELFPPYPKNHPIIVPNPNNTINSNSTASGLTHDDLRNRVSLRKSCALVNRANTTLVPNLQPLVGQIATLKTLLGKTGNGIGSNSWVISGKRSATGKPILANDPHLGIQMPSIWYQVALHCTSKTSDCPYNVGGFSFAGMPGVIIGHNDRIAWGYTNVDPDVADLYIEKINPNNPNQYEFNGKWVDMKLVQENIQVAGSRSLSLTVRYTRHGPIISDTYKGLENFSNKTRINLPQHYAIALRWTALETANTFRAVLQMNRAQNWNEFRAAAKEFDAPSQNLIYADTNGNIGDQMPGKIPIRASGDGSYPVPGWTENFEWKGYIPFPQLPFAFNPPQGYIVTANNAVVGSNYPYLITKDWDYGFRAQRIIETIEAQKAPISLSYVQQMQGDNKNLNAANLVPILLKIPLNDARWERVAHPRRYRYRNILVGWDFQQNMDKAAPALFETFWKHLLADTFHDDLPKDYWPDGENRWVEVISRLVQQPNSPWWDNKKTPDIENRDRIFRQAFAEAVDELEGSFSKDPAKWRWGNLHTATFRNATLGRSGIALIAALFNRGPFSVSGGSSIVNATGWNATESFEVAWLPSMRMIVDLDNLQNSLSIHTPGQSGHAFHPHYDNMIEPWRKIQYQPFIWEPSAVQASTEARLTLTPP